MNKPLLSLCIPTYNRAPFLDILLERIAGQAGELVNPENLELIVSDNCSDDNTPDVVKKYLQAGLLINYIRNESNLGMDGNFVQCFRKAKGKYIWLLGDDDFLKEGALNKILQSLNGGDYGLVHLDVVSKKIETPKEYTDSRQFISDVSYWITFISGNIVNSKYVPVVDFEKYMGTFFTLMPLYMTAAFSEKKNLMIYERVMDCAKDPKRNGGYDFFEVFVNNYLNIWKEFVRKGDLSVWMYEREKYFLMRKYLVYFIVKLLIRKEVGNYRIKHPWRIMLKKYWYCPYFYAFVVYIFIRYRN